MGRLPHPIIYPLSCRSIGRNKVNIDSMIKSFPVSRLHQRLQVFVEYVRLADSEDVWCLNDTTNATPNLRYIVPKKNVVQDFIQSSKFRKNESLISSLRLSVKYPYRIEVEEVGWLYQGLSHGDDELGEMIAFNPAEVSFRLDPIKYEGKI